MKKSLYMLSHVQAPYHNSDGIKNDGDFNSTVKIQNLTYLCQKEKALRDENRAFGESRNKNRTQTNTKLVMSGVIMFMT